MASAQEIANSVVVINALIPAASTPHASTQATNQVKSTATVRETLLTLGMWNFKPLKISNQPHTSNINRDPSVANTVKQLRE